MTVIAGTYQLTGAEPAKMKAEKAWLLYPVGSLDVDPEIVIGFRGILPKSVHRNPNLAETRSGHHYLLSTG